MLLSRLSGLLERRVGTSARLPSTAIECELPARIFRPLNADGYCVLRKMIGSFVASVYPTSCDSISALQKLKDLLETVDAADPSIVHVVIHTSRPRTRFGVGWFKKSAVHRSLVNHERFHAETMMRSHTWHVVADGVMENTLGELWTGPRSTMLAMQAYASTITNENDESWVGTTETLARIAAVLHAPKNMREEVAAYQLHGSGTELLKLASAVENRWGSAEALVGWLDARLEL